MEITLTLDESLLAQKLMQQIRRNFSDDSDPFCMSELHIFDVATKGPITTQTLPSFLFTFFQSIPITRYQEYLNKNYFSKGKEGFENEYSSFSKIDFEIQLQKWLTTYADQVRSPLRPDEFEPFSSSLHSYLGRIKFFIRTHGDIFKTPHYYCINYNALILTQNKNPQTSNKAALFSFFASD